ncbi:MAG: S8 family peptidase, partial [Alistipes inops]
MAGILASCAKDPAVSGTAPGGGNERNEEEYVGDVVKGKIRIRLADNATALRTGAFTRGEADSGDPELDKLAAQLGATKIERVFGTDPRFTERHKKYGLHLWYDVTFDEDVPVSRAQSGFESLPGVAYVRPIYRIYPADGYDTLYPAAVTDKSGWEGSTAEMPFDDPGLPMQWHYYNDGTLFNTEGTVVAVEGADVNLFKAWEMYGAGDPSVVVAVMDMGIQYDHPDLVANMWVNEGELNGEPNKDNDGNGIKNDIYGYNGLTRDGNIEPGSHGTHVAGTVAATNNNGIGVSGVAGGTGVGDGARLMSCQIFAPNDASESDYPDVYRYAADNGAVISQNSWNYPMINILPEDMSVAFDYFIDNAGIGPDGEQTGPMKGGVIIFAAGNEFSPKVGCPSDDPRVITVTSMMADYVKASYSNYGTEADIFAPGGAGERDAAFPQQGQVYSTGLDNTYTYHSGTSMACPHVSGVAALIVSHYGANASGFTNEELKTILLRSYRNVDMWQTRPDIAAGLGAGLVDASLMELENPGVPPEAPAGLEVAEGTVEERLTVSVTGLPADGNG